MSRSIFLKSCLLVMGLSLTACSSMQEYMPTFKSTVTPVAAEPDVVSLRIAEATEKASQALSTIASIEQQRTPLEEAPQDYSAVPALTQPITVRWTGPMEQMVKTLASRAGFTFAVRGAVPPVPVTITVDVYQTPLMDVLRDLGLQAGRRADVMVDSQRNIVEIRYAPVD